MSYLVTYHDGGQHPPVHARLQWQSHEWIIDTENGRQYRLPVSAITHFAPKDGGIELKTSRYPYQTIFTTDPDFIHRFTTDWKSGSHKFMEVRTRHILGWLSLILLVVAALCFWFYFKGLPFLSEQMVNLVSKEHEQKLGEVLFKDIQSKEKLDSIGSVQLQTFGHQLGFKDIKFHLAESSVVNAYAIPGHVVVYTGLLDKMKDPAPLAALLGHEVGHIRLRHSLRSIMRQFSGAIVLSLVFGDASAIWIGEELQKLSYSRKMETEADEFGLKFLHQHQLPLTGMDSLFSILQTESEAVEPPAFLSTHPLSKERQAAAREWLFDNPQSKTKSLPVSTFLALKARSAALKQ